MLDKIFWDVFQKTGNIEAYLASKEYGNSRFNMESSKEFFPSKNNGWDEKSDKKEK